MLFYKPSIVGKFFMISRLYGKNILRRKPIRILNLPSEESSISTPNEAISPKMQLTTEKYNGNAVAFPVNERAELMIPPYEKIQNTDARFTKTLTIIKNRKMRENKGKMLIEGKRLINDAVDAGLKLETIYFSREKDLADIKWGKSREVKIFKVLYKTLSTWSDLTTCPGVMGIFKRPTAETIRIINEPVLPVTIICDNIRDPGNLGSIIRNAAGAGCENILLMKGCVDPWDTKVLRAGCGGHFRIPILNDIEWSHVSNYIPQTATIFIADNSADIEGSDLSPEFISFDEIEENTEEPPKYVTTNEHGQSITIDETFNEPRELEKFEEITVPAHLYSSIKYPRENIILYVGGETHGVDPKIVKLSCQYGGRKVKIPLENNMESLNSSFAMTLVLYEIKRQLSEKYATK